MRDIHRYGYRWDEKPMSVNESQSLTDYVADGKLSSVLGRYWGCSTPNLYFYDRTEADIEARIRWFHNAVPAGLDLPWLRIRGRSQDRTFDYDRIADDEKEDLRRAQRHLLREGPLSARIIFDMFGQRQFRRTLTERAQGWVLVPLGEILSYSLEWRVRKASETIHKQQPDCDLDGYFETRGRTELMGIWTDLMSKLGGDHNPDECFEGVMLHWLQAVVLNEHEEYSDWWKKRDSYDWFICLGKQDKSVERLKAIRSASRLEDKLSLLTRLMVGNWDYKFETGKDIHWGSFLGRLRFSPPMEVDHFGTRNLIAFPTWLQWLHNGQRLVSANAAFVFAGFYDAETARQNARDIQMLFVLLTAPDIAKHTIPKLMLARAGLLAEATTYELRQPLSSLTSLIDMMVHTLHEDSKVSKASCLSALEDMKRATGLIERVARDLLYLPVGDRPSLDISLIDVNGLIEEALDISNLSKYDDREGIRVKREYGHPLPPLRGDKDKLRHAFLEIIINAKEALHGDPDPNLTISTEIGEKDILIVITDNGQGMDSANQFRVFDPFFSTKQPKGMGLGLFNVKNIIEAHGGRVKISSISHKGTSVTLRLPIDNTAGSHK